MTNEGPTTTWISNTREGTLALSPFDVVLGRNRTSNHHLGNRRFRQLINERAVRYRNCSSVAEKSVVIQEVLAKVKGDGGRFVELVKGEWVEVPTKRGRAKVKHALNNAYDAMERAKVFKRIASSLAEETSPEDHNVVRAEVSSALQSAATSTSPPRGVTNMVSLHIHPPSPMNCEVESHESPRCVQGTYTLPPNPPTLLDCHHHEGITSPAFAPHDAVTLNENTTVLDEQEGIQQVQQNSFVESTNDSDPPSDSCDWRTSGGAMSPLPPLFNSCQQLDFLHDELEDSQMALFPELFDFGPCCNFDDVGNESLLDALENGSTSNEDAQQALQSLRRALDLVEDDFVDDAISVF